MALSMFVFEYFVDYKTTVASYTVVMQDKLFKVKIFEVIQNP